ncbi:MAG: hypothetical protein ACXADC_06965 [Candidatus Thorarchaeota archaeon]
MTEIPLPPGDYQEPAAPPKKGPGCGTTMIVVLVIAIVVVAGVIIVLLPGLFNGGLTTTTPSYSERQVADYMNQDIDLSPTYYRGGFTVSASEVQTSIVPDLLFDVYVRDTGSDGVSVSVHIAVYETSVSIVDGASTWGELTTYQVDEGDYPSPLSQRIDLYNYASSYTWVIWFDASSKLDTWDVDITLTLRYNWVAP